MLKKIKKLMSLGWKRSLRLEFEHHEVFGLDIGSSEVKLIQLRKNGTGYAVTAAGIAAIAAGEDGKNRREINTIRAIRGCLKSAGIQTQLAVCSVCGPEIAVRHFKFPTLPPKEVEGAVLLEAEQVCPFNVHDGLVDYQVIPNGADSVTGVLVATTNTLIKSKVHLAKNASLKCVLMDVDGLALLNCLSEYEKVPQKTKAAPTEGKTPETSAPLTARTSDGASRTKTAVLNVGGAYSTLAIMGENIPFIRDMAYASNDIVKQIAVENGISTERVWKILFGREEPTGKQVIPDDSLEKACKKLIDDVTETLRYYTAQEKSAIVENIFVCGDFAPIEGFVELLDSRLPAKASMWNPFDKIPCDAGRPCENSLQKNGPAMAVAAGLAMREI